MKPSKPASKSSQQSMRHPLQQQQLATQTQPPPPVVNHTLSTAQPALSTRSSPTTFRKVRLWILLFHASFCPRGSNSRHTRVTSVRCWVKQDPGLALRCPSQLETTTGEIRVRKVRSGMVVHGKGFGIAQLRVCQVASSMATIVW